MPWDASCDPTLPPAEYDKDKLFDVWSTHTKDCQYCQTALKRIDRIRAIAFVAAIGLLIAAVMVDARSIAAHIATDPTVSLWGWPPALFWGFLVGSGGLAIVTGLLQKLRQLFFVYRFEHADND